jgi:hypothetical protein
LITVNYIYYFVKWFRVHFANFPENIAPNVPAVYDGLAARIRALRSKDQGCKNVTEQGSCYAAISKWECSPATLGRVAE